MRNSTLQNWDLKLQLCSKQMQVQCRSIKNKSAKHVFEKSASYWLLRDRTIQPVSSISDKYRHRPRHTNHHQPLLHILQQEIDLLYYFKTSKLKLGLLSFTFLMEPQHWLSLHPLRFLFVKRLCFLLVLWEHQVLVCWNFDLVNEFEFYMKLSKQRSPFYSKLCSSVRPYARHYIRHN